MNILENESLSGRVGQLSTFNQCFFAQSLLDDQCTVD